ncbi:hypothetical protein [Amycolatopsis sp. NBC_00438]|uniref:hypothetical protein n=1 Tax=Amycolatopsis sp. NBC_00438 TaxID=2903558 RepID=UPI002E1F5ECB
MDPYTTAPRSRWRRGVLAAGLVIPFTASQIWALLVLLRLAPLDGLVGQAFWLILLGSVAAIWAGWRWTWQLGRDRDLPPASKARVPT